MLSNLVKRLFFINLLLVCGICPSPESQAQDKNKPEVNALIGMHIPAKSPGSFGTLPGWHVVQSALLQHSPVPTTPLGITELTSGNLSIFVIDRSDASDWSWTILDALVLPQELLPYRVISGRPVPKPDKRPRYSLQVDCTLKDEANPVIALARPSPGMEHCENAIAQVKRSWRIHQTGIIEAIPTSGVNCRFVADEECETF
ncbi:MAG: hypothetical protein PHR30_01450 [Gallionellaceae bacterium]|nr:hypothetical protein [Gallionellaceae bacterium]